MNAHLVLVALLTVAAAPVLAHSPRNPSPMARLDALAMPGLAPARALMASLDRPAPRGTLPAVAPVSAPNEGRSRRILPFFWGWRTAPLVVSRHFGARCEVVYSPYAGRVETCTVAPYVPLAPTRHGTPEFQEWLESR